MKDVLKTDTLGKVLKLQNLSRRGYADFQKLRT